MKRTRFTEAQIFTILKEFDAGRNIQDIARSQGVSKATIYNWKAKYGGMEMNELKRIKELEEEKLLARLSRSDGNSMFLALSHSIFPINPQSY